MVDSGASSPGPAGGLTPEQLAGAYGYEPSGGGAGQTVGIVDAYDDPKLEEDLGTFDSRYGLPACTTENGCFKKVGQTGSTASLPAADTTGWSAEISLDVETVHAVCPDCKILLVEANSASFSDLATAVNEAVALGATEVSNSYGGSELETGAFEESAYDHPGVPILAASGDTGYYGWISVNDLVRGPEAPNAPASLPTVVAVGGTSLKLNASGTRAGETVWNENGPGDEFGPSVEPPLGATGGGCSGLFTAQPWQREVAGYAASGCGKARLVADVSAVGDPATGFDIYDSYKCAECEFPRVEGGWATFGGTSLSAQLIGALYGLAGGGDGVRYPSLTLYGDTADASSLFDVTSGGNGFCGGEPLALCGEPNFLFAPPALVDCEGTTSCNAGPGFDGPSGVGTPNGLGLFKPELPTAVITPPGSLTAGTPASFNAGGSSDPYPGGTIASYSWSWGDGSADSVGVSPSHTYAAPGSYNATLTVTDNYGLSSTVTRTPVSVNASPPQSVGGGSGGGGSTSSGISGSGSPGGGRQGVAGFKEERLPSPGPDAKLASTALQASLSGIVSIKISCPAGESSCSGTVTLRTESAVIAGGGSSAKAKGTMLTLATASFTLAGGQVKTVMLHLSARARRVLARYRVLHVRATIVAHDPAGATHTTRTIVTLRAPKSAHGKG